MFSQKLKMSSAQIRVEFPDCKNNLNELLFFLQFDYNFSSENVRDHYFDNTVRNLLLFCQFFLVRSYHCLHYSHSD